MQVRWLSVEGIMAHLGDNTDTIYKWITRKELPAQKVDRLWKFLASEVDAWVQDGRAAESASAADGQSGGQRGGEKEQRR